VPENDSQANLMFAGLPGHTDRSVPPAFQGDKIEMMAWADMLSRIGQKNSRLYDVVGCGLRPSAAAPGPTGPSLLHELERERSRIARELHAGAGQPLAGIQLNLDLLGQCSAALPEAGRQALARLHTLAEQAMAQVRAVSHSLHPPEWQGLTIEEALRELVESSGLAEHLDVAVDIRPLPAEPSHAAKIALYRCAQECISNVVKHSRATRFEIALDSSGGLVELRMRDNGAGFPQETPGSQGIGLRAIHEHAAALGGSGDISSGPDGVRICVRIPFLAD
jgi:signal transduction histidine kinase